MKTISLTELAVTDLSVKFARRMDGNKIIHYKANTINLLANLFSDGQTDLRSTAKNKVIDYIKASEGNDVEVVFTRSKEFIADSNVGTMPTKDVSKVVLQNDPDITKALKQRYVQTQLLQYIEFDSKLIEYKFRVGRFINENIIKKVNSVLNKFFGKTLVDDEFGKYVVSRYTLPYISLPKYNHNVTPCAYLSVSFEESKMQEGVDLLLSDLRSLNDRGLIMGHLAMPTMMPLADTVGSGQTTYVIFCFLFVDMNKMYKQDGKTAMDYLDRKTSLNDMFGVKTMAYEGAISGAVLSDKYEIESVDISTFDYDKNHQARVDNFLETLPVVAESAKRAKARLDGTTVQSRSSETVVNSSGSKAAVAVNAVIKDGKGNMTTLSDLYKKNSNS